jgi:hypothetical protein
MCVRDKQNLHLFRLFEQESQLALCLSHPLTHKVTREDEISPIPHHLPSYSTTLSYLGQTIRSLPHEEGDLLIPHTAGVRKSPEGKRSKMNKREEEGRRDESGCDTSP